MPVQFMGHTFWRQNLQKRHTIAPRCAILRVHCLPCKAQEPAFIKSRLTLTVSPQTEFSWHKAKGTHLWKLVSFSPSPGGSFLCPGGSAPIAKDSFHLQLKAKICSHKLHRLFNRNVIKLSFLVSYFINRLTTSPDCGKSQHQNSQKPSPPSQRSSPKKQTKQLSWKYHTPVAKRNTSNCCLWPCCWTTHLPEVFYYSFYHAILLFHDCGSLRAWVLVFCGVFRRFSKMICAFRIQVQIYILNMHCSSVLPLSAWSSRHSKAACFQISGNKGTTLRSWNIKLKSAQVFRFRVKPSRVFGSHCMFGKEFKHIEYIERLTWSVKPGAVARERISIVARAFMFLMFETFMEWEAILELTKWNDCYLKRIMFAMIHRTYKYLRETTSSHIYIYIFFWLSGCIHREMCEQGPTKSNMNHEKQIGQRQG